MDKDTLSGWIGAVLLLAVLIVGSIAYYAHNKEDCDARGGILVRSVATNLYECVSPLPPRP